MNTENKMREALELADAALYGANMNMNVVKRKVKEALALTSDAAPVLRHWKLITFELIKHLEMFTPYYEGCQCDSCATVNKARAMLAASEQSK